MPPKNKYTDPELRDKVKQDVQDSDKGGAPGQWSARKAQFMASEYKKRGGSYNTDKESGQDASQKNLSRWGDEQWQTKEGSGHAKLDDGTEKRYLPKKAWEQMSEQEKQETEDKKLEGGKKGKQYVGNTGKAKGARQQANKEASEKAEAEDEEGEKHQANKGKGRGKAKEEIKSKDDTKAKGKGGRQAKSAAAKKNAETNADAHDDDVDGDGGPDAEEAGDDGAFEQDKDAVSDEDSGTDQEADEPQEPEKPKGKTRSSARTKAAPKKEEPKQAAGSKRSATASKSSASNKKQKGETIGSKHDKPGAPEGMSAGSATRLPKKGQKVSWKALPGWCHGTCVEVVREAKEIKGKTIKGKENDPRIVLEAESGKIAGHKPESCYF